MWRFVGENYSYPWLPCHEHYDYTVLLLPILCMQACVQCNGMNPQCETIGTDGPGVREADYVLYVSAVTTATCASSGGDSISTIAFASACQLEATLDRYRYMYAS